MPSLAFLPETTIPLQRGYINIPFVSTRNLHNFLLPENETQKKSEIQGLCARLKSQFKKYKWKEDPCGGVPWQASYKTAAGNPLIYAEFGNGKDTTLFLGGVHPDELVPIQICFRLARYLQQHPELYKNEYTKIVVAPLVTPDVFFTKKPTRTNGVVDTNRNFLTADWYKKAHKAWARRQSRARYFPGYFPNTEIETLFQNVLIEQHKPDKILSLHAPLGFLDYDGPGDQKPQNLSRTEKKAKQFVYSISKITKNYRIVDYSFYPGSLGNYAGNERNIPTITVELETNNPHKVGQYWKQFKPGFIQSIHYPYKK